MKNNDYLFAVAAVRANEAALLKDADIEQLINAPDYRKAIALLGDKGWDAPVGSDYSAMLDKEVEKAWELLSKSAPEAQALKTFVVANDFQNLKAVLKAQMSGHDAEKYLVSPCVIEKDKLLSAVKERKFDELPDFISAVAQKAFETITKTSNGQLCDIIIDTAALETMLAFAKESEDESIIEYAESFCAAADIKTAYRAIKTGKNKLFFDMAVAACAAFGKEEFITSALRGQEEFYAFLSQHGCDGYRTALEKGTSAFEKYCDDTLMKILKKAKMTVFGVSPLAAYFIARETEVKCLRIILSAKLSGVSADVIRERMRELYV